MGEDLGNVGKYPGRALDGLVYLMAGFYEVVFEWPGRLRRWRTGALPTDSAEPDDRNWACNGK